MLNFLFGEMSNFEKIARDFENKKHMINEQIKYQKDIIEFRNQHKGKYPYEDYNDSQDVGELIGLTVAQRYLYIG